MDTEKINALANTIYSQLLNQYLERDYDADMTMILSVVYTCKNYGIDLEYSMGSPEDKLLTEYVNARIAAYNESRKNAQSL